MKDWVVLALGMMVGVGLGWGVSTSLRSTLDPCFEVRQPVVVSAPEPSQVAVDSDGRAYARVLLEGVDVVRCVER